MTREIKCPDCTASIVSQEQVEVHDPGCPLMGEEDRQTELDRLWFVNHPGADEYYRKPTWSENSIHRLMTDDVHVKRVRVERVSDTYRIRHPLPAT